MVAAERAAVEYEKEFITLSGVRCPVGDEKMSDLKFEVKFLFDLARSRELGVSPAST